MKIYKNTEDLSLGERIKYLRKKKTTCCREDVTAALRVCRSTCSHYERGFFYTKHSKSMKLAEVFPNQYQLFINRKPDKNIDKDKRIDKKSKLKGLLFLL